MNPRETDLGIIGGGRAAWAFGASWRRAGGRVSGVALREDSSSTLPSLLNAPRSPVGAIVASSGIVLVAVSDSAIPEVAAEVSALLRPDQPVFHPSGSLTSALFEHARLGFSLHPFRALPALGSEVDLGGALLVFEGPVATRTLAASLVESLGGIFQEVPREAKIRYHAAAVLGSNHVAALLDAARATLQNAGLDSDALRVALADLARSAILNWEEHDGAARFTGPVARGDSASVGRHLDALAGDPALQEVYRSLSLRIARAILSEAPDRKALKILEKSLSERRRVP